MNQYLPPKELELASSVLAIIADPKAAQARLDALKAATAEYDQVRLDLHEQTIKNTQAQKQLTQDQETLDKDRSELDKRLATDLPKLVERDRVLTIREQALNLQLAKQKQDLTSLQTREAKLLSEMADRELRVQGREEDVRKKEVSLTAREAELKTRLVKLKAATE